MYYCALREIVSQQFESFPASQECKDRSAPMPASVVRK